MIELIARADAFAGRTAFRQDGDRCDYATLLRRSAAIAAALLAGRTDLDGERIAFLLPAGADHAAVQWGIWRAGGIAIALNAGAAAAEIEHVLRDAGVRRVLAVGAGAALAAACDATACACVGIDAGGEVVAPLPEVAPRRPALIVYTSGTTSKPKGVVWTHAMVAAQVRAMVAAWGWRADDCIPLFLPLHHVHGIVNVMCTALWCGACIEPYAAFSADAVLARVRAGAYTVFMAVPTVYVRLIERLEAMPADAREAAGAAFGGLRLMVSGSAALPASVHARWRELTGQVLLERYGMTEIGMALSNPLHGERRPGTVGTPMPGVAVRLVDEDGVIVTGEHVPGEIQVRGPGVFTQYWARPDASAEAFTDGWFRTGDIGIREHGYYRIMGRSSVDILKSGGYKLSALEIENVLLDHPVIRECAVLGLPDPAWGELVAVAIVTVPGTTLTLAALHAWCEGRLSGYKWPRRLLCLDSLPRNALGKVLKPVLRAKF